MNKDYKRMQMMNAIVRVELDEVYDSLTGGRTYETFIHQAMLYGFGFPPLNNMTDEELKSRYDYYKSSGKI